MLQICQPTDVEALHAGFKQKALIVLSLDKDHDSSPGLLHSNKDSCVSNSSDTKLLVQKSHKVIFYAKQLEFLLHRDMSPNPENIDFRNAIQQDDQEEQEDSGFFSGSRIKRHSNISGDREYEILMLNKKELDMSGFYYPETDRVAAMRMLQETSVGTFLIRDSSDSNHLFSLSVQTHRGATSVRIDYKDGLFMFDCDKRIRKRMPKFKSVLELVNHHVKISRQGANNSWRWEEKSGKKNMVLYISKPCRTSPPSLKHLCNIQVNKSFENLCNQIYNHPSVLSLITYPYEI